MRETDTRKQVIRSVKRCKSIRYCNCVCGICYKWETSHLATSFERGLSATFAGVMPFAIGKWQQVGRVIFGLLGNSAKIGPLNSIWFPWNIKYWWEGLPFVGIIPLINHKLNIVQAASLFNMCFVLHTIRIGSKCSLVEWRIIYIRNLEKQANCAKYKKHKIHKNQFGNVICFGVRK